MTRPSKVARLKRLLGKLVRGEPILRVVQDTAAWDAQFKAGTWDYMTDPDKRETLIRIAEKCRELAARRPVTLLDVGCGNGGLARLLKDTPAITYYGSDISEEAIAAARSLHPAGKFSVASAETPPAFAMRFDCILFNEILYYTDFRRVLDRHRALLAPHGSLVITMYDSWRTRLIWLLLHSRFICRERIHIRLPGKGWRIEWGVYRI